MFELTADFWIYLAIGFAAQIVDGALGMAYGTLSTSILLATGLPPVLASASVHTAQFFTTGIAAASHAYFKNIDRVILIVLSIAGICGGMIGATLLTKADGDFIKPWIAAYLLLLGLSIIWKFINAHKRLLPPLIHRKRYISALGFLGGLLDSIGGGGWGPIVTSNLIAHNEPPRQVIGSVNAAEFFVKTAIAGVFIAALGFQFHQIVLGLLVGGIIAAPLGAFLLRFVPTRFLLLLVGILISGLSIYQIITIWL